MIKVSPAYQAYPRFLMTKDEAEYVKSKLPLKYSLQLVRNRWQTYNDQMILQQIRFMERGGDYEYEAMDIEETLKFEQQSDLITGYDGDATNSGDDIELQDVFENALLCKIQEDIQRIQQQQVEESDYQPEKITFQEQSFSEVCALDESEKQLKQRSYDKLKLKNIQLPEIVKNLNLVPAPPHLIPFMQNKVPRKKRISKKQKLKKSPCVAIQTKSIDLPSSSLLQISQGSISPLVVTNSSAPIINSTTNNNNLKFHCQKLLTTQQKHYLYILNQVSQNNYNNLFSKPLSPAELQYLGYSLIEQKQINISIIEQNIISNKYSHLEQLHRDLLLVWLNSYSFKSQKILDSSPNSDKSILKSYLFNPVLQQMQYSGINQYKTNQTPVQASKFSAQQRAQLVREIKKLSSVHLSGVWKIVVDDINQAQIHFDVGTMEDKKFQQLKNYIENCKNKHVYQNAKQQRQD